MRSSWWTCRRASSWSGWRASAACPGRRRRPGCGRRPPGRSGWRSPPSWWTTPAPCRNSTGRSASCGRSCGAGPWPPGGDGPHWPLCLPPGVTAARAEVSYPGPTVGWVGAREEDRGRACCQPWRKPSGAPERSGAVRPVSDLQRSVAPFKVITDMVPAGDQPRAINEMERGIRAGTTDTVLLGATGTGKTATVAWLAERLQRPVLVMLPNKTLAAQFANELREMLPDNAVEYFVSYYDYYQPEAYVPQTDTYIEKDSSINDEVDRLRHSATNSLLTRRDTIVVASVSCIYGLGTPQEYVD